jgi:hypothetical protein
MKIPTIQIRTQPIRIGMETTPHRFTFDQPRGIQEIRQPRPELTIEQPRGDLQIDQTQAWDALGYTHYSVLMDRIVSEARRIFLEGIAKKAEQGDRLAAIHQGGNPVADIAWEQYNQEAPMSLLGEARYDNVEIRYTAQWPNIDVNLRPPELNYTPVRPHYQFTRGQLNIYVLQYPSVTIIPPQLDIRV